MERGNALNNGGASKLLRQLASLRLLASLYECLNCRLIFHLVLHSRILILTLPYCILTFRERSKTAIASIAYCWHGSLWLDWYLCSSLLRRRGEHLILLLLRRGMAHLLLTHLIIIKHPKDQELLLKVTNITEVFKSNRTQKLLLLINLHYLDQSKAISTLC